MSMSETAKARRRAYMADYRMRNAEKLRAYGRAYAKANARREKFASIKCSYGLTQEQWTRLLWAQAGLCASCCQAMSPGFNTCVDHDHVTGAVRGLVCRNCNVMLGQSRDSALTLRGGADYLDAHGAA